MAVKGWRRGLYRLAAPHGHRPSLAAQLCAVVSTRPPVVRVRHRACKVSDEAVLRVDDIHYRQGRGSYFSGVRDTIVHR